MERTKPQGVVLFIGNVPWEATDKDVQEAIKSASGIECDATVSTRKDGRSRGYANTRVSEEDAKKLVEMTESITIGERSIRLERRRQRPRQRRSRSKGKDQQENGEVSEGEQDNKEEGGDENDDAQTSPKRRRRQRRRRSDKPKQGQENDVSQDEEDDDGGESSQKNNERLGGKVLFFGNLPWATEADDLQALILEKTGVTTDDIRISKRKSGRSRGYATARVSEEDAKKLLGVTDTIVIGERKMRVEARKRRQNRQKRRPREYNESDGDVVTQDQEEEQE